MQAMSTAPAGAVPRSSWLLVAGVSAVTLVSALFVALTPADGQTTLTDRTFAEFAAGDPEVASRFSMQLVLVGIIGVAFSLLSLVVALIPYRAGERWAWLALWLVPVAFGLATLRMLVDGYGVGYYYLVLTIVAAVGLLIPAPRMLRGETNGPG